MLQAAEAGVAPIMVPPFIAVSAPLPHSCQLVISTHLRAVVELEHIDLVVKVASHQEVETYKSNR